MSISTVDSQGIIVALPLTETPITILPLVRDPGGRLKGVWDSNITCQRTIPTDNDVHSCDDEFEWSSDLKDRVLDHAERDLQMFFMQAIAYHGRKFKITLGKTECQHGYGCGPQRQAEGSCNGAHSSLQPSYSDNGYNIIREKILNELKSEKALLSSDNKEILFSWGVTDDDLLLFTSSLSKKGYDDIITTALIRKYISYSGSSSLSDSQKNILTQEFSLSRDEVKELEGCISKSSDRLTHISYFSRALSKVTKHSNIKTNWISIGSHASHSLNATVQLSQFINHTCDADLETTCRVFRLTLMQKVSDEKMTPYTALKAWSQYLSTIVDKKIEDEKCVLKYLKVIKTQIVALQNNKLLTEPTSVEDEKLFFDREVIALYKNIKEATRNKDAKKNFHDPEGVLKKILPFFMYRAVLKELLHIDECDPTKSPVRNYVLSLLAALRLARKAGKFTKQETLDRVLDASAPRDTDLKSVLDDASIYSAMMDFLKEKLSQDVRLKLEEKIKEKTFLIEYLEIRQTAAKTIVDEVATETLLLRGLGFFCNKESQTKLISKLSLDIIRSTYIITVQDAQPPFPLVTLPPS